MKKNEKLFDSISDIDEKYIDEWVRKFFDVDITTEEMDYLYSYFLSLTTIPPKWKYDAPIIRAFAIMRY